MSVKDRKALSFSLALFVLGLIVSAGIVFYLDRQQKMQSRARLAEQAKSVVEGVKARVGNYESGLRSTRAMIQALGVEKLDRSIFKKYVDSRPLKTEFPGAHGLGFIRRVNRGEEESFIRRARADGWKDFKIWSLAPYEGDRLIVQYVEPEDSNRRALGLDISSEPMRHKIAWDAILSGESRLTKPITLVQASGKPMQGFLLMLPVYERIFVPNSQEARRRVASGLVYEPLVIDEVLAGLKPLGEDISLKLYDAADAARPVLFFSTERVGQDRKNALVFRSVYEVYGQTWLFECSAGPRFFSSFNQLSFWHISAVLVFISAVLAFLVYLILHGLYRGRKEQAIQSRMAAIVSSSNDAIVSTGFDGQVESWNVAAEKIFGFSPAQAIGRPIRELIISPEFSQDERDIRSYVSRGAILDGGLITCLHAKGERLSVAITVAPIHDEKGAVSGCAYTLRDVSDELKAQAKIVELNTSLETQVRQRTADLESAWHILRTVIDESPEFISMLDKDGHFILANRSLSNFYGMTTEEFLGKTLGDFAPDGDSWGLSLDEIRSLMMEGKNQVVQESLRDPQTGEIHYFQSIRKPLKDTDDETRILVIAHDVTDLHRANKLVEESERRYVYAMEAAGEGLWDWDLRTDTVHHNAKWCEIFGFDDSLLKHPVGKFIELLHEDDREDVSVAIERALRGEEDYHHEHRMRRLDGSVIWVFDRGRVIERGGDGQPLRMAGGVTDISERKLAEIELEKHRETMRLILDSTAEGIYGINLDGRCTFCNRACLDILGYDKQDDLLGRNMHDVIHHTWADGKPYFPQDCRIFQAFQRAEGTHVEDEVFWRKDGKAFSTEYWSYPQIVGGVVVGAVVTFVDITQRKLAEKRLIEAMEAAEAASRAKSRFVANMSHEVRTPMNAVLGMLGMLADTALDHEQQAYVGKIQSAANALLRILNDILDFSKLDAGAVELESRSFVLDKLLLEVMDLFSPAAAEKGLELVVNTLPGMAQHYRGDALRLGQILNNLVGNAIKFTEYGSVELTVFPLDQQGVFQGLRFEVRDTGMGLSTEQSSKLFQPFSQADSSTTRRYGGSGLGLSICKRLAELMGGNIGVDSCVGEGSTFWFSAMLEMDRSNEDMSPDALEHEHVMVVDDHEAVRESLGGYLASWGFDVECVADVERALGRILEASASSHPVTMLLADWSMPGHEAAWLIEQLGTARLNGRLEGVLRVFVLAGHDCPNLSLSEKKRLQISALLRKPVTSSLLFDAIITAQSGRVPISAREHEGGNPFERCAAIRGAEILLVEDNQTNQEVALSMLQKMGMRVQIANDGKQALEKMARQHFDAVLMDLHMPVMDGLEATEAIRAGKWGAGLPVIAMTAAAFQSDRQQVIEAGMNDYVSKPVDPWDLASALLRWIPVRDGSEHSCVTHSGSHEPPFEECGCELLTHLEGFNIESALERVGRDQSALVRILQRFKKDFWGWRSEIEQAMVSDDRSTAIRLAHTLKGASANIGAVSVQTAAAALECDLKKGAELTQGLMAACANTLESALLGVSKVLPNEVLPVDAKGLEFEEADLVKIEELLRGSRLIPDDLLAGLRGALDAKGCGAEAEVLWGRIEDFDFKGALEQMLKIRMELSG